MNIFTRIYYQYRRILKAIRIFFLTPGPGIIVMVADNDAGGITTYTLTSAKYGMDSLWFLVLLGPVVNYVQEIMRECQITLDGNPLNPIYSLAYFKKCRTCFFQEEFR